jgi:hypothetical protein
VLQIQLLRWRFDIKNANTEDARNKQKQEFLPSATHSMLAQISSKTASKNSCFLPCWLSLKHALRTFNQISSFVMQCGNAGEFQEGKSWRLSSATSWGVPRSGIKANLERVRSTV